MSTDTQRSRTLVFHQIALWKPRPVRAGRKEGAHCILDIRWNCELPSAPSTVTISKDASGRYFVSCLCDFEPTSLPVSAKTVGIDVGLKDVFVTDTGFKTGNPRYTAKYTKRLALLQRRLSKQKKAQVTAQKPD